MLTTSPTLDPAQFSCLYLNAGCLAEQALVLALQAAADAVPGADAALPAAGAAALPSSPDTLDWGALDGLSLGCADAALPAPAVDTDDEAERAELSLACALGPPAVYDAAAALAPRIARLHARAPLQRLAELLARLPIDAAPLTARLNDDDFARWCAHLAAGDAALLALVAELRSLDPPV